jgi:hypothetical protein
MKVILSRYEIKLAVKLYIEQKLKLKVIGTPAVYEATQSYATYAEADIKDTK